MAEEYTSPFRTPEVKNKPRGNAAGNVMSSNSGRKELPHYLRASTGSCHDLCKYGRKQEPEEKPWRSNVKSTVKKLPNGMNKAMSPDSSETKRVVAIKQKQVLHFSYDASEIIKREVVKSSNLSDGTPEPRDSPQKKKMTTNSKLKSSPVSGISGNANSLKLKVMSRSHSGQATMKSKEPKQVMGKASNDVKIKKKIGPSKVVSKKVSESPRALVSPNSSIRLAENSSSRKSESLEDSSCPPNQNPINVGQSIDEPKQLNSYPVEEKTLHIVEKEEEKNEIEEDDLNEQCIVEKNKIEEECVVESSPPPLLSSIENSKDVEEDDKNYDREENPRAGNEGDSADKGRKKLNFKEGSVLDVNCENESPRRLKYKKKDDIEEDKKDDTTEIVSLRHQDVQNKKEEQGLFNNVIEETASKLVETRKSKVQALVGAFETVISLQ